MTLINTTLIRRFLAAHPDHIGERLHLARLLEHNGDPVAAREHYRIARARLQALLAQEPADPTLYEQLARVQLALGDANAAALTLSMAAYLRRRVS